MKHWLEWMRHSWLPQQLVAQLEGENRQLRRELERAQQEVHRLEAYVSGIHAGMRWSRRRWTQPTLEPGTEKE